MKESRNDVLLESFKDSGEKGKLYRRIAEQILEYINQNQLKPGDRIPSERKLAEMFSSSRSSVREAVRVLQNKNILEVQIGNGMYIKEDISEKTYSIELWKIDYMELLDIKTTLEYHIIEELCEDVSLANIRSIEENLRMLEESYNKGFFDQQADYLFHQKIRRCSKNNTLVQLIDNLIMKLDEYAKERAEMRKVWYLTIPQHRILFQAIINHDKEKAKQAFYKIYELDKSAIR